METWRRNLLVCWFAVFVVSVGMSQMAPMLPLYIEHMGIHDPAEISRWSGIVFGCNFVSLAIFSPIWGKFSDRYGRKTMILRASLWLSIIMAAMGFAQSVYQLMGLRLLQGALSGFQPAVITLIATQTPKERSGWALGMLFSGQVGGTLLGPVFGGYLTEVIGFRETFFVIGGFCFVAFLACAIFVAEEKKTVTKQVLKSGEIWSSLTQPKTTICLFVTTLMIQFALMSVQPILTVYIKHISESSEHIAIVAGAVFAASGLASVLAAPVLGKLSDRLGPQRVLLAALFAAGLLFIPQAFVESPMELGVLRFLVGLAVAGLLPSINTLIRQTTPDKVAGRIFGYNQSAQHSGVVLGSIGGGQIAAIFGIHYVFYITAALLLCNAFWVYRTIYQIRKPL
ncbi:MAG: multidrug efflux MFS transporter [Sporomusaceae bacterium]|nr:multidrug efflux MFS transporter [Sporomusaceae bacterium]